MRAKMTGLLTLFLTLFIVLLSCLYLAYTRNTLERSFAASLDRIAQEIPKKTRTNLSINLSQLETQIEEHNNQVIQSGAISERVEAWLLDANGQSLWHLGPQRPPHRPDSKADDSKVQAKKPPSPFQLEWRSVPPLDDADEWRTRSLKWGNQTLLLALPWHRVHQDLNRQAAALFTLCVLLSGASAFGAWVLVGSTLRPIEALTQQARLSGQNSTQLLERRSPLQATSSDREIEHLVSTLNQMLDNVHEAALSKERFHTSASHELRTPLQALGGHLGVTLSRDRSAAEYKLALEEAATQTARLSKLTGDLLLLNRLQTAASTPLKESVDVAELCDIALQRAEKTLTSKQLQVVEKWESLEIEAAPSHVEILLSNLLENAAKYARKGGEIGIEIDAANHSISVWNECETGQLPILQSEVPRLFEPFYRPDSARTSETGGNGLGLAICHNIAEANGWRLQIQIKYNRFWVNVGFGAC